MDKNTVKKLNQINKTFYENVAKEFDETRQYFWDGWNNLAKYVDLSKISSVLDLGCGNGRFAKFLYDSGNKTFSYTGIDFNQELLNDAEISLKELELEYRLLNKDFIEDQILNSKISENKFDLIVSFGVLHHIPGFQNRRNFVINMLNLRSKNGFVFFSIWNFSKSKRFSSKILKSGNYPININEGELESGDYFLNWDDDFEKIRYCHDIESDELNELLTNSEIRADWLADKYNNYILI